MESCWSLKMDQGAPTPRFTQASTIGRREPAAQWSCSHMYKRPWEEVEVKVRAPTVDAATQTVMTECSLSTRTYSAFSSPRSTHCEIVSVTGVEGVIG